MTNINYGAVKLDELLKFKDLTADATDNDLRALGLACVHRMHLLEPAIRLAAAMEKVPFRSHKMTIRLFNNGSFCCDLDYKLLDENGPDYPGYGPTPLAAIEAATKPDNTPITE